MKLTLYNIDKYIREKTHNARKAYYTNQEAVIIEGTFGFIIAYFDCNFITCESPSEKIDIEMLYSDNGDQEFYPNGYLELSVEEIIKNAPSKEIDSHDFFHAKDYNFHEQKKFIELKQALIVIGVPIENDF